MYIPVKLCSSAEGWVYPREEEAGEDWGDVFVGDVVEDEGESNLVEM